jgi:hypothetical protein
LLFDVSEFTVSFHRLANDLPLSKIAAGSVLVEHFDGFAFGAHTLPVLPTSASLPSTAVYG